MTRFPTPLRSLFLLLLCSAVFYPAGPLHAVPFLRGDADANGTVEMADAVRIFGFLFLGTPRVLPCKDAADANDSGNVDLSDGVTILSYLFLGGPELPPPFPGCGYDPTEDALDCRVHAFCPVPFCEKLLSEGTNVDVGGHTLRYLSQGQGCPGIVLDAGLGDSGIQSWNGIAASVAQIGRILLYDRAGYGSSQLGPEPRTPEQLVTELHTLLEKVHFEPPYVLVGHSMSGYTQRVFASMYPAEVGGMVFVDGSHEHFFLRWAEVYPAEWEEGNRFLDAHISSGAPGAQAEWRSFRDFRLIAPNQIPDVPIVVLTGLKPGTDFSPEVEQALAQFWDEAHELLARSVTNGTHISLPGIGHYIHQERPQVVIDAIRQVVEAVK